jgi:hypothetical protein
MLNQVSAPANEGTTKFQWSTIQHLLSSLSTRIVDLVNHHFKTVLCCLFAAVTLCAAPKIFLVGIACGAVYTWWQKRQESVNPLKPNPQIAKQEEPKTPTSSEQTTPKVEELKKEERNKESDDYTTVIQEFQMLEKSTPPAELESPADNPPVEKPNQEEEPKPALHKEDKAAYLVYQISTAAAVYVLPGLVLPSLFALVGGGTFGSLLYREISKLSS